MLSYEGLVKDTIGIEVTSLIDGKAVDDMISLSFYDEELNRNQINSIYEELHEEYNSDILVQMVYSDEMNRTIIEITLYNDKSKDKNEQINELKLEFSEFYKKIAPKYYIK